MKNNELLLAILAQLEREGAVSIPQLARLLDCSEEQVFDALEILVFAYDAASIRLDLHDTYATLVTNHHVQLLRLTPHEADVLIDALGRAGLSPQDELIQKLLSTKGMLGETQTDLSERIQTVSEGIRPSITQTLATACEDERHPLVQIAYRGENDTEAQERVIEPVAFLSKEGARYLFAYCRKAQGWRLFRLDRIKSVEILDERFTPRPDIPSASAEFMHDSTKALIRFLPGTTIPNWHGLRNVKAQEDGSHIASIDWTGSTWLPKHIVALTGDAIPIEPPELIGACAAFAKTLVE